MVSAPEVADHFRHLDNIARGKFLQVCLVTTRPVGWLLDKLGAQYVKDLLDALLVDNVANANHFNIGCWDLND